MGFFDDLRKSVSDALKGDLAGGLQNDIQELMKGDGDSLPENPTDGNKNAGSIGHKAIIDDPFFDQVQQHFIFKNKLSRISNKTLKDTSVRDWVVSAIIQARVDTMLRFARPQRKQWDMGYKIQKKENRDHLTAEDRENISNIEDYLYHCGRKDKTPPGEEMLFGEFLKLCTRDALTFGHIGVEKVLTRKGSLHRFRPVPAESVYRINQKTSREIITKELENARKTYIQRVNAKMANNPTEVQEHNEPDIEYYKYVQMSYDNRVLAAFGDEDFIFKLFNPQNFADSMGYCYSPLELAIINITNHLNVENYNANFFTHGYAARGVLHLKGTVTQAQLTAFRRQFYNSISGAQHAWRTPIIAGLDDIQWIGLSGSAKEMEYLNYNNHLIRALCTQFQIDPVELGLDYLVSANGKAAMQQANNEYKIAYSRERGLIPILMMFEDMINCDILPMIDKELARQYEFKFTGYDDESAQTNISLMQAEMTVHSSMNDLLRTAGKETVKHPVFEVPLSETFWNVVNMNMTKGEIRAAFFGDKEAVGKRELAYIPGDPAFMGWQQLLMTMDRMKKQDAMQSQQMQQEAQAQQQQAELDAKAHGREQEQHDVAIEEAKSRHAHAAVGHSSSKDIAKEVGAASQPINVGGKVMANPINKLGDDK